jgi:tRNA U34 5-methylaminomethyl-2-thiouridine-forming methyltransferase MnmC
MSNLKSPTAIERILTADGSPTLRIGDGEKMHSIEGALSESLYIYRPCIEKALEQPTPRILSMGLGLGYNELIAAALLKQRALYDFVICSFEAHPELRSGFLCWLQGRPCRLSAVYDEVAQGVGGSFQLAGSELKESLLTALAEEKFHIQGALTELNPWPWHFHGVLYDAFSSGSDEGLWTEEHLNSFLAEYADREFCSFATYAATGSLKRSLLRAGFTLTKKKGFAHKRESTLGFRQ